MINDYQLFNDIIKDKKVLHIPIYSCFDYQSGLLNFKADGNVNRFLTTWYYVNQYSSLSIFCPQNGNNIDWFCNSIKNELHDINLIFTPFIKKSAKIERSIQFAKDFILYYNNIFDSVDYIVVESQHLYQQLELQGYYDKLIYWCPVCAIENKTRDFLEPYKEFDRYLINHTKYLIVASNEQVEYAKTLRKNDIIQINSLIDRSLNFFNYEIDEKIYNQLIKNNNTKIFLPFRLTDEGYKMKEIFKELFNYYLLNKEFIVYYSNPNNCDIYKLLNPNNKFSIKKFLDNYFIQVSKNRNTYYTILDYGNVIIPYLEDINFIAHASVSEFETSKKCKVISSLDKLYDAIVN